MVATYHRRVLNEMLTAQYTLPFFGSSDTHGIETSGLEFKEIRQPPIIYTKYTASSPFPASIETPTLLRRYFALKPYVTGGGGRGGVAEGLWMMEG